jgi:hypothetical protein
MCTRYGPLIGFLFASFLCLSLPSYALAHAPDHPTIAALDDAGSPILVIAPASCFEHSALAWRRIETVGDLLDVLAPLEPSHRPVFVDEHRERAVHRHDALLLSRLEPPSQRRTYRRPVGLPLPNH